MRLTPFFMIALFASRCGVEAGNVGKGRTGQVKVLFAQETVSGNESLSVSVGSLGLLASDDSEKASLDSSVSTVDLYGSGDSESVLVAESSEIPVGSYSKISIRLKGDKPVKYRDAGGLDHDVEVDELTKESFTIAQAIEVADGETTTIIVNLDPYQSLAKPSDDKYVFSPRGEVSRHGDELRYQGTTTFAQASWACLYAYQLPKNDGPLGPMVHGEKDDHPEGMPPLQGSGSSQYPDMPHLLGPDGGKGHEIEGRPRFDSKEQLVKDETADCAQAYAKTPVKDGKFEFRYLNEGLYSIRIFASDGSYEDAADDIELKSTR